MRTCLHHNNTHVWSTMSNLRRPQLAKRRRCQDMKLHGSSESYQDTSPTKMLRLADVVFNRSICFCRRAQFYNVQNIQGPNIKNAKRPCNRRRVVDVYGVDLHRLVDQETETSSSLSLPLLLPLPLPLSLALRWWVSIVVRTSVLAGELSLSRTFPTRLMDGRLTTLLVKRPLSVNQQGQLSLPSLRGRLN